jgi:uncharacterized protein DUF4242
MLRGPAAPRFDCSPQSRTRKEEWMPRYVVERTFPGGLTIPAGPRGAEHCREVVERNADAGVTWVHSYVSSGLEKMFCVYDAPSPEAIRKTAALNELPVDRITQVRVLDPYFYDKAPPPVPQTNFH